ncbi:MAG: hypothetical protein ACLR0U_01325 [Enterocloster clostridioformis]
MGHGRSGTSSLVVDNMAPGQTTEGQGQIHGQGEEWTSAPTPSR